MSDAPACRLFELLLPIKGDKTHLPKPLVVLQVTLEGNISKQVIMDGLSRTIRCQDHDASGLRERTFPRRPILILYLTFHRRWVTDRGL